MSKYVDDDELDHQQDVYNSEILQYDCKDSERKPRHSLSPETSQLKKGFVKENTARSTKLLELDNIGTFINGVDQYVPQAYVDSLMEVVVDRVEKYDRCVQ